MEVNTNGNVTGVKLEGVCIPLNEMGHVDNLVTVLGEM